MAVEVTPAACREIHQIVRQQGLDAEKIYLRVGVKGGGCSGFNYILDLTESKRDEDEMWTYDLELDGEGQPVSSDEDEAGGVATEAATTFQVRVICDPKSYLYLNGTSVDFKESIMARGFQFNNPNATNTCGCGSSFAV